MFDADARAETIATRTPTQGTVKGKLPGFQRLESTAAHRTGERAAEHFHRPFGFVHTIHDAGHEHGAAAGVKGCLHTLCQPGTIGWIDRNSIDHNFNPTLALAIEGRFLSALLCIDSYGAIIDADAHIAAG